MTTVSPLGSIPLPFDTDPLANIAEYLRNAINHIDQQTIWTERQTVTNSVVLSDITDLTFHAEAGKKYAFEAHLVLACADQTPDARIGVHRSVSSGDLTYSVVGKQAGSSGTGGDGEFGAVYLGTSTDYIAVDVPSGLIGVHLYGTYKAVVDADITPRIAQNVANAADTIVEAGSYLKVQVIP